MKVHLGRHFIENNRSYWTRDEKKVIWYCHSFASHEVWPRGNKTRIFEEKIAESSLCQDKVKKTTSKKLKSIVSQIPIDPLMDKNELEEIAVKAKEDAEIAFQKMPEDKVMKIKATYWTREERWVLIWAIQYVKKTCTLKPKDPERRRLWEEIFYPRCPYKRKFCSKDRYKTKLNTEISGMFTEDDYKLLDQQIDNTIKRGGLEPNEPLIPPKKTISNKIGDGNKQNR